MYLRYISPPPPPRVPPHTFDFVVLTYLTRPRKILLVVLQICWIRGAARTVQVQAIPSRVNVAGTMSQTLFPSSRADPLTHISAATFFQRQISYDRRVEAGQNTSTVSLRLVGGDEK
jgi:hypothetical protein